MKKHRGYLNTEKEIRKYRGKNINIIIMVHTFMVQDEIFSRGVLCVCVCCCYAKGKAEE